MRSTSRSSNLNRRAILPLLVAVHLLSRSANAQPYEPPNDTYQKYLDRKYRAGSDGDAAIRYGKMAVVLSFIGSAAFLASGVIVNHFMVGDAKRDAEAKFATYASTARSSDGDANWAAFSAARDDANDAAKIRTALYIGAGLAAATGILLLFVRPTKPTPRTYAAKTESDVSPPARISAHGLSFTF